MDLIGVIHLLPLPAAPGPSPGLRAVLDRARRDARALVEGGLRAAVVENLGDAPFVGGAVDPHVVASMTAACLAVRDEVGDALQLGVNVLRNDAAAALAVAGAVGGRFIRVNVHVGAAWTDQGLVEGRAAHTLRYRRELGLEPRSEDLAATWQDGSGSGVFIAADVHVKHATPAGREDISDAAADLALRGRAEVVIVSGRHTGGQTDLDDLRRVRARLPRQPLWVGSGVEPSGVRALSGLVDGAIVGTWLHQDGRLEAPLDVDRVRWLVEAVAA
ncbi:BtpA/SgcQ family protein [Myxococcota bacterium]|nr:BtpA/SgcQ family protein [Myxococcota bacterium]